MRVFKILRTECIKAKYERKIQQIYDNNSSNEQLYREKKEM
jgi:hypothetical protein